jgi:hypothetical protein
VGEKPGFVTAIAPTLEPTLTPEAGASPTIPVPTKAPVSTPFSPKGFQFPVLVTTLVLLGALSVGEVWLLTRLRPNSSRRRSLLGLILGGLAGYDSLALAGPGSTWTQQLGLGWTGVLMTFLGSTLAFGILWASPWLARAIRGVKPQRGP